MLNCSLAVLTAVGLFVGASEASASLLGTPMNLKSGLSSVTAHAEERADACVLHTDDVFAGPVTIWTCRSSSF